MSPTSSLDADRLHRLIAAGRSLVSRLDLDEVLDELLEVARQLTGARYAALGVLDADRRRLERFLTKGVDPETHRAIGDLPRGRGVLGALIDEPRPLRLASVADDPRSFGFPPGHPDMSTFLGVPVIIRGEAWGNLYLTEKAGGEQFDDADEETAIVLGAWAAIAVDNARLYQDVERRRDALEEAVLGLEATTQIARAIGGETDLARVLELIVKRGRALVRARSVLVDLVEGDDVVLVAGAGDVDQTRRGWRRPFAGTLAERALTTHASQLVAEVPAPARAELAPVLAGAEPRDALLVPLVFRGRALGLLTAFTAQDEGGFGEQHERLLQSFAASAATAVATAQSVPPTACAAASRRPSASGAGGRASCTTRRCRPSRPSGCSSPRASGGARRRRSSRSRTRPSTSSRRRSPRCARSSPSCARRRWTSSG
jgi:GAF domain-containing protein